MEKIQTKMPFKSKAQQRFMFSQHPKIAKRWAKHTPDMENLPQHVSEEDTMPEHWDHPGCEDKIGKIFVVLKPGPESSPADLVHQTHAFGVGQFDPQGVHGVYNEEDEANLVAEAACNELRKHLEEIEAKKHTVVEKIDKHIARLQKEINHHMKEASELPEGADQAHALAEEKMNIIKGLREKRKMVEAAKKPLEKIEEGVFDRMISKLKGAGAQASTTAGNFGAFLKGDKDAIKDSKLAKSVAVLKQKATTLKKELEDVQKDLEKLFPPDVMEKLPKDFIPAFTNYLKSLETIKTYNDRFVTGDIASGKTSAVSTKGSSSKKSSETPATLRGDQAYVTIPKV